MKLVKLLAVSSLLVAGAAHATTQPQSDGQEAFASTVSTKSANYTCQGNKKIKVTYGFNAQGLPTYAKAYLNGKDWVMTTNLYRSDNVSQVFGDEDNFSLMASPFTSQNYKKTSFNIQNASGEILYKSCQGAKAAKKATKKATKR